MIFVAESLTRFELIQHLRYANQMAVEKIVSYIDKMKDGEMDEKLFDDAELLFNLIDSIKEITPIGDMIDGIHASARFTMWSGLNARIDSIKINNIDYPSMYMPPAINHTQSAMAEAFSLHINSFYPQNPYYAIAEKDDIIIYGVQYNNDNGAAVSFHINLPGIGGSFSGTLDGGVDGEEQESNCLTNANLVLILNKISSLIDC